MILFLRILARGSNDYEYFLSHWKQDSNAVIRKFQPYNDEEIRQIHSRMKQESRPRPLRQPDQTEQGWLYEVFQPETLSDELFVLETEDWVKKMKAKESLPFLGLYHQVLKQMVDTDRLQVGDRDSEVHVFWGDNEQFGIAYYFRPDLNRLLLLDPVRDGDHCDSVLQRHESRLQDSIGTEYGLSRIAVRSYPLLIVLDVDAWVTIQKDEEANLALSPEEAELVDSIHNVGFGKDAFGYPLFINGRAGSGKSTMLQYLAADYVNFALRRETNSYPLYMTCSRDLLDRARTTVRRLLTAHHSQLIENNHYALNQINRVLDNSFIVFSDFLYSLLPTDIQKTLVKECYVNYGSFRHLWSNTFERRPAAKRISLDVSWHVIRSYIKGIRSSADDSLNPEEFDSLPRRHRSVSKETYKQIYDEVWHKWYKPLCEENGFWDDQDLAAHVLDDGAALKEERVAIFCDEAQDFTPAELDIIFQLSLFSRRILRPEELKRVPIAFAGDPLQTINPTGFRWDAVKADFHERFCAVLDPHRSPQTSMSYRELNFNYRSNPGIVRFCNLIQLVRAGLLGDKEIRPQMAWWIDAPVQTVWFTPDNQETTNQLHKHPELVKLVDCQEGEETTYVVEDDTLQRLAEKSEGIYRNVLSPTRAKGLEFSAVVLYRFGENVPAEFGQLLDGDIDSLDSEKCLTLEYFFNRLYVAASRAKDRLIVIDSEDTINSFWRFATDLQVLDRLIRETGKEDVWKPAVSTLFRGTPEAWSGEHIDQREQAEDYANQGRRDKDPYLLRQAGLAYRSAGEDHEAGKCFAEADELEGKQGEAGDKYKELGLYEEALRCYWKGRLWEPLKELAVLDRSLVARLECRAAGLMSDIGMPNETFLGQLCSAARDKEWLEKSIADPTWQAVLISMAKLLARAKGKAKISWAPVYETFDLFVRAGVPIGRSSFAAIAYAARNFREAAEFWERDGNTAHDRYNRAKANITPFPQCLVSFRRLKDYGEILRQWRDRNLEQPIIENLDERIISAVADAALDKGDLRLATKMIQTNPDETRVVKLLSSGVKRNDYNTVTAGAIIASRLFVQARLWTAAVDAADKADFKALSGISVAKVQSALLKTRSKDAVLRAVVWELANSEALVEEHASRRTPIVRFLARHFVGRGRPSRKRRRGISPKIVGAAIERAGMIVDALRYYESLMEDDRITTDEQRFAAERLIRNLERYDEYFRNRGDTRRAQNVEIRATRLRARFGIGDRTLVEYPVVDKTTALPQLAEDTDRTTEWHRSPFKIVSSMYHGRLRIEHMNLFETVTVDLKDQRLLGDANFSEIESTPDVAICWEITGWNATVELIADSGKYRVRISCEGQEFEVPSVAEKRG